MKIQTDQSELLLTGKDPHLVGKVKSVIVLDNKRINRISQFNENGNKTEEVILFPWGETLKVYYNCNDEDWVIGLNSHIDKEHRQKATIKYIKKRNSITIKNFSFGKFKGEDKIVFDKTGHIIEEFKEDEKGNREVTFKYFYDRDGNIIKKETFLPQDSYSLEEITAECGPLGELDSKETYKYDKKGNMIEYTRYDGGLGTYKFTFTCDEKGNRIKEYEYDSDDRLKSKTFSLYDDKGHLMREYKYNTDGKLESKHIFSYDNAGNWIKDVEFKNDIQKNIREREITYYE